MERTRNTWKCPLFGVTCDLKDNVLPTYEDVMKFYDWTRHNLKYENSTKKEPTYKELEIILINKLREIWNKASIPTVEPKRMKVMLHSYYLKCKNILKSHPNIPKNRLEEFRRGGKKIFDIATCKCLDILNCTCSKHKKIPVRERCFLVDQRTVRKMVIGGLDVDTTQQLSKALKRKLLRQESQSKRQKISPICTEEPDNFSVSSVSDLEDGDIIELDSQSTNIESQSNSVAEVNYALLSQTCDRFGVSNRAGAAIASAVLQASTSQVIDKCKLQRERTKARDQIPTNLKAILDPVIQRNGYYAHPENVLLAMLTDSQPHIRELAARRILKARSTTSDKLRLFQPPKLNLNATTYYDILDWQESITEPPVLKSLSQENLKLFIEQKGEGEIPLLRLPCHTQAVERAVKAVIEASATLCNNIKRDGYIKAQIIVSRKIMPKFESKKDFAAI